jgi:16S rRNA (uracil1498-N3)-methyltransferase
MPQFFVDTISDDGICTIEGDDFHHLVKVRRVKKGDVISLRDAAGALNDGIIENVAETKIVVKILRAGDRGEDTVRLTLCVSILKGKKFDLVLQKAVEVGVSRIVPVITERTVPLIEDVKDRKTSRWQKIASEASKQSMRAFSPLVEEPVSFHEAAALFQDCICIIAHTDRNCMSLKEFLKNTDKGKEIAVLVGPEGGFSEKEMREAVHRGWQACNFGFTAMRSETAAIVLPALIIYELSGTGEDYGKNL